MKKGQRMSKEQLQHCKDAQNRPELIEKYRNNFLGNKYAVGYPQSAVQNRPEVKEKKRIQALIIQNLPSVVKRKREAMLGRTFSELTIQRMKRSHLGVKLGPNSPQGRKSKKEANNRPAFKRKLRIARLRQIEQNYGICYPNYNKTACEYFKRFDGEHNTKGQYAVYGGGEYQIKELGYFTDYINFDLKLIQEWDEKHHYINGELTEKDKTRQEEIQKTFPDFKFERIKE